MGTTLQLKGRLDEAVAECIKGSRAQRRSIRSRVAWAAYTRAGQREEAHKVLVRLSEEARSRYVQGYSFALVYLALGDKERAIDEMERAYRERDANVARLKPIRCLMIYGNERFEALVNQIVPANVR